MPRIPDSEEFARLWSQVAARDRRRIVKAVNRGEQLENRKEAALAVVLARRQQRFWRVAWLLGPIIALVVSWATDLGGGGTVQLVANALLGAAVLMGMSVWFSRRAKRAEELNTERAVHGRRTPRSDG